MTVGMLFALMFGFIVLIWVGYKVNALLQKKISGYARVLDGDTILIGQHKIRLFGIDAPETNQFTQVGGQRYEVGKMASQFLREKIGQGPVSCRVMDRDRYGRYVAICKNAEGEDLGKLLVQAGMAVAYCRYTKAYRGDERKAKRRRTGLWAYGFQAPEQYRQQNC